MNFKKYDKVIAVIALVLIFAMVMGSVAGSFLSW